MLRNSFSYATYSQDSSFHALHMGHIPNNQRYLCGHSFFDTLGCYWRSWDASEQPHSLRYLRFIRDKDGGSVGANVFHSIGYVRKDRLAQMCFSCLLGICPPNNIRPFRLKASVSSYDEVREGEAVMYHSQWLAGHGSCPLLATV